MNRIRNVNLDLLKRAPVLITVGVVVVALLAWYFAWWSPEGSKLTSVDAQVSALNTKIQGQRQRILQLTQDVALVHKYRNFLTDFDTAIPSSPDQGQLTQQLYEVQQSTNVLITSLNDSGVVPPAAGSTLGTIPLQMSVTGTHAAVIQFLKDLYSKASMPRLITVQSANPSSTSTNALQNNTAQTQLAISATAYYTAAVTPTTTG